MATNFKLKRSAVASKRPGTTDLELGELALNTYDGFLYSETTGAGSTVSLLTPWQEKYGQGSIYYTGGSVGIGTTNPTTLTGPPSATVKLHIHDTLSPRIQFTDASTGGASGDGSILGINGEDDFFINNRESGKGIKLFTGNDERVSIDSDGRVGIGTTVPSTILDVNGDVTFRTANGKNILFDKSDNSLKFGDSVKAKFGDDINLEIYHGTDGGVDYNEIQSSVGNIRIRNNDTGSSTKHLFLQSEIVQLRSHTNNHTMISAYAGSQVELFHNNEIRFETTGIGVSVTGLTTTTSLAVSGIATFLSAASFLNNDVLYFGGSSSTGISTDYRLRIYSDGTDSYISEATGAGDLRLSSDSRVEIRNAALDHTVASFNTGVGVTVFDRFKVSGISSFTGNVDLGISTSTTITATSRFDSDLVPSTNVARDLGSSSLRWRTLYVSNLVVAPGGPGFAGSNLTVNNLKVIGISTFLDHADFDSVSIGSTLNVAGVSTFNANVHLLDDDKLQLGGTSGTVDGLELYHDSTQNHSYIDDTGSGNLKVRSNNLRISNGGETKVYATFKPSEVDLYADNSVRLTTSGSGVEVTGIITATTGHFDSVTGPSTITIDPATIGDNTGTVVIKGDLQVDGTTTTVNSTTLTVTDKNIEIAKGAGNDAAVDGAGITVDSTQGDKTWNWVDATDAWTSSEHIHVAAGKRLGFADDDNTFIDRPNADVIAFTNGGTERLRIRSDGKVSIGHTSGDGLINTLNTGVNQQILQFKVNLPSFSNRTFNLYGPETDTTSGFFTFQTGDAIRFQIESIDALTVASDGQIGIGTTNPDELLHLKSSATTVKAKIQSTAANSYPTLRFANDARTYDFAIDGATDSLRVYDVTATEERLTITSSGNVGINSTAPREKLDVIGNANIIVDNNKGIKLGYRGENKTAYIGLDTNDAGSAGTQSWANSAYIGFYSDGSSERSITYRTNVGSHIFQGTNGTEFARINSTGSVGIGSTTPDAKLSVVGVGTFKEDVYIDKKLYVGGIEIIGPGTGIGTDITTRHLRATGITTTEQLLDADGGADIAGIATAGFVHVGNLTSGRVTLAGAGGSITDSSNLTFDGSTLLVTGTLNSTVDVQINGTSVVDTALNDAVAMAIALG